MKSISVQEPKYLLSAFSAEAFPDDFTGEIAFIGRSNVGKSSLINFLMSRKNLAHVSRTPGRTRGLNLFSANFTCKTADNNKERRLCNFVDLPGVGYAKLSKKEKELLSNLLSDYIDNNRAESLLFYLLDARRKLTVDDIALSLHLTKSKHKYVAVITKIDEIPVHKRKPLLVQMAKELIVAPDNCILSSSHANLGREPILLKIWEHIK